MATSNRTIVAARLYAAVTLIVVAFQLALAAGMPWGTLAMGGRFPGRLPPEMRVAAVVQALLLVFFAAIVATRAGLVLSHRQKLSRRPMWLVIAVAVISVILNAITPSTWERAIWLPVTLVMLTCSVIVARSR